MADRAPRSRLQSAFYFFFFFNDTATTEIYTLSLHDALPILDAHRLEVRPHSRDAHAAADVDRSEEHTSELQSRSDLVCRLLLEKKKKKLKTMLRRVRRAQGGVEVPPPRQRRDCARSRVRVSVLARSPPLLPPSSFFFFNDTAPPEIYTLSLHDPLPICSIPSRCRSSGVMWYRFFSIGSGSS